MTELERHPVPAAVDVEGWALAVDGAVDHPIELDRSDLESLPSVSLTDDFACEEGWVAEDLTWRGVRVDAILDRVDPVPGSEYGLVSAMDGDYACSFPLDRLRDCVLAVELDGAELGVAHGGPARLVPPADGRDCWESVKWVAGIRLQERAPTDGDTARDLALSRLD